MASYNSVILMGNVARDPKIQTFQTGTKKADFVIACGERGYKKKDGTEVKPTTEYINCTVWGNTATIIEKYVTKGSLLHAVGKIKNDAYEKDGQKHYKTYVNVSEVQLLPRSGATQQQQSESPAQQIANNPAVAQMTEALGLKATEDEQSSLPF